MTDEGKSPPFYERRAFQGTAAVVALGAAVLALIGPLKGIADDLFGQTEPVTWVEVVLDTSAAMEKEFDGETRLEAAAQAVEKSVKELDNSGLGLRRSAVDCAGESDQVVKLGADHVDDVIDAAENQHPTGSSSIVDAVVGGLEEFNREPMASRGPESRRLLVFTAGVNECTDGNLGEEVADALAGANISQASKVELIALGASDEELEQLRSFEAALGRGGATAGVTLYTPQDRQELDEATDEVSDGASTANEQLEGERGAGFYEQK
jgi:hypothetical protein